MRRLILTTLVFSGFSDPSSSGARLTTGWPVAWLTGLFQVPSKHNARFFGIGTLYFGIYSKNVELKRQARTDNPLPFAPDDYNARHGNGTAGAPPCSR